MRDHRTASQTRAFKALLAAIFVACAGGCAPSEITHAEVLAGIHHVAPGVAWASEAQAYEAVALQLLDHEGQRLVITPISDHSLLEASIFAAEFPAGENDFDDRHSRQALQKKVQGALGQLEGRRTGTRRTEIINAILGAADRFASDDRRTRRMLILLTSGFEQSSIVDMADYHLNLNSATIRRKLLEHLEATGQIAALDGVEVCMLAITSGVGEWADYNRTRGVHLFWQDYFAAAKAKFEGFGTDVSACRPLSRPATARE